MKIKIKRRIMIEASVQEMAATDVRSLIGEQAYTKIKGQDPHPLFIKLDVGKQGASHGKVILNGIHKFVKKIWNKARIQEMARCLNRGVPLFARHGLTNSKAGRDEIGRTIKAWCEEMADGVHAMAVGWIPSSKAYAQEMINNGDLDICSIEAGFLFSLGKVGQMFVDKIVGLTAVALGSRKAGEIPGFATSGIIAQVQEMSKLKEVIDQALKDEGIDPEDIEIVVDDDDDKGPKRKITAKGKNRRKTLDDLTLGEVQVWVKNQKVIPTQLFSLEELLNVKAVSEAMQAEVTERVETVESEKETVIGDLQTKVKQANSDLEDKVKTVTQLEADIAAKADALKIQENELGPYKDQQRREKLASMVVENEKLKDVPQEQADYIAAHVSVPSDIDLSANNVKDVIGAAIDAQLADIEKSGIQFGKKKEEEIDVKDDGEFHNPLIPTRTKK